MGSFASSHNLGSLVIRLIGCSSSSFARLPSSSWPPSPPLLPDPSLPPLPPSLRLRRLLSSGPPPPLVPWLARISLALQVPVDASLSYYYPCLPFKRVPFILSTPPLGIFFSSLPLLCSLPPHPLSRRCWLVYLVSPVTFSRPSGSSLKSPN